jgi:hypothetical protein
MTHPLSSFLKSRGPSASLGGALRAAAVAVAVAAASSPALATGMATCDSGAKSGWQPTAKLEAQLKDKGWTVRRIKEDGGCYEVYALDEKGKRGEFYFHPVTLEPVPTQKKH